MAIISQQRSLFLALDTFSKLGGLQNFNRRVISALNYFSSTSDNFGFTTHLMRDQHEDIPSSLKSSVFAFGNSRKDFIMKSLSCARSSDTLILGHINLLPIASLIKLINPRIKVLLFVHGVDVWNDPIYRKKRFYEPALLSCVDMIASVSQYTASIMSKEYSVKNSKFNVFPNAIDGPLVCDLEARKPKNILAVTRMAEHDHGKNIDKLLIAHQTLIKSHPDAILEVVGDGVLRTELEALANDLNLGSTVHFLGRVSNEELDSAYRRATVFALPSSKEGFGIVYLEAWKYGLPVICSTQGASHEVVENTVDGFCIDPEDVDCLASVLLKLIEQPDLAREVGANGAKKLEAFYMDLSFRSNLKNILASL
ncbi:glycosyltransferase family 1 protein [Leucothrix sargassi]|nr:glycosyltransferase family 1 protein [Leucothrix sargassi]